MASVGFPSIPVLPTFRYAAPDFSALGNLPEDFWKGQEVGRENELRGWIKANPNAPIEEVARHIMAADPARGSQLLQSINNQNALNDYRRESLVPPEVRLIQYAYGPDAPTASPGPIQGTSTTPAPSGAMQLGPDGQSTAKEALRAQLQSQMLAKSLTPAEKAVDQNFGSKIYPDWVASGGSSGLQKQQEQLQGAIDQMGTFDKSGNFIPKNDNITGPWIGILPKLGTAGEFARNAFFPTSVNVQEQVEQAIQQSLRQVLGYQYTQVEGENLLKRTFNPNLPEEVNARRAQQVLQQLNAQAQAKDDASRYYEQHGTLKGWKGHLITNQSEIQIGDSSENKGSYDAAEPAPPAAYPPSSPAQANAPSQYGTPQEAIAAASRSRGSAAEGVGAPPPPPANALGRLRTALKAHPEAEEEIKAAFERKFGNGQKGYADHYIYGEGR